MNAGQTFKSVLNYNVVPMTSGLLLILDFLVMLLTLAVFFVIEQHNHGLTSQEISFYSTRGFIFVALIASIPAPFFLYDKHFGAIVSRGRIRQMLRSHLMRYIFFVGIVLLLSKFSSVAEGVSMSMLLAWAFTGFLLTSVIRLFMGQTVKQYQRRGTLTEVIAIVGAGPVADRLVQTLQKNHGDTVELLGVFDDKILNAPDSVYKAVGNIESLIELGKTRKIDWILLTLPPTAERRVREIVIRLKALSVPIGLCPQHVGLTVPYRVVDYVGDLIPVNLLTDRPASRWETVFMSTSEYLPRWIITLMLLPLIASEAFTNKFLNPSTTIREYE